MEKNCNTALLIMDMQMALLSNYKQHGNLISSVYNAIIHAREKGIPVIYVVVGFRKGAPEISANNKIFSAGKDRFTSVGPEEFTRIEPAIAPLENEIVVVKRRISAFTGSDLEVILRTMGIQHLVLTGIATGGVVLSTLREAADRDYRLTVLADCCADGDPEVHKMLTEKVFPRQAEVMTVDEWTKPQQDIIL